MSMAAGPLPEAPFIQDTSDRRYANDLDSADRHDRLFAARVLHRRVREAHRVGTKPHPSIRVLEAQQKLDDFDRLIAPQCVRLLEVDNISVLCIKILGLLQTKAALQPLQKLQSHGPQGSKGKAVRRAIKRIKAGQ
jgi:hypothetical protein